MIILKAKNKNEKKTIPALNEHPHSYCYNRLYFVRILLIRSQQAKRYYYIFHIHCGYDLGNMLLG
jgi:hypothetical protein